MIDPVSEPIPLVAVRPEVMAEAEHAFGNLFHRLHYAAQKLRSQGVAEASILEATVNELEEFLRLTLDYASPVSVDFKRVSAVSVLGSLSVAIGGNAPDRSSFAGCYLTVDPGRLSQAFQLMACGLVAGTDQGREVEAALEGDGANCWLTVRGIERSTTRISGGRGLVAWALAQKLVDAQGGTLAEDSNGLTLRWTLRVPASRKVE